MNTPFPATQFNQKAIVDYIEQTVVVDENDESLSFGDIIIKQFDSYTGIESPDGRLISGHVVGFNDGKPLVVGLLRSDAPMDQAISALQDRLRERCMEFMMKDLLGGLSGESDD